MPDTKKLGIGTRVKIKNTYLPWKAMRGMIGTITWASMDVIYMFKSDTVPHWRGRVPRDKDWCFVQHCDVEIIGEGDRK